MRRSKSAVGADRFIFSVKRRRRSSPIVSPLSLSLPIASRTRRKTAHGPLSAPIDQPSSSAAALLSVPSPSTPNNLASAMTRCHIFNSDTDARHHANIHHHIINTHHTRSTTQKDAEILMNTRTNVLPILTDDARGKTPPPSPPVEKHDTATLQPPFTLHQHGYTATKLIGSGAFSQVFSARHHASNRIVALKMIPKHILASDSRIQAALTNEVDIHRSLHHPNIVDLYESFETESHFCLALELVEGGDLFDYLVQKERLSEPDARLIFRQIVNALEHMHTLGIVHRDLKLENILITPSPASSSTPPSIKLADFGLAARLSPEELLTIRCGSNEYAAPELIQSTPYDGRLTDAWALGVILYTLVAGQLPFQPTPSRPKLMFHKICRGEVGQVPGEVRLSEEVMVLMKGLLCPVPARRLRLSGSGEGKGAWKWLVME